jgi:hypothetical protein
MKLIKILILANFFQLASCQNTIEMDFSNTKWVSDSLNIKDQNQWREFVFIDSIGNFTRTTWWNENYILDNGKLNTNKLIITGKSNYKIEIIDSFNIKISTQNYEGYFNGNPWEEHLYFLESLNRFIVADSVKNLLVGNWLYEKNEVELNEYYKQVTNFTEFDFGKLKSVAHRNCEKGLRLIFLEDNTLTAENNSQGKITFKFKAGKEVINIKRQDYIVAVTYQLLDSKHLLVTKKSEALGKSKIYFKKE